MVDENNDEWFFVTNKETGWWTLNTVKVDVSPKMIIKLHQQRVWFDGRSRKYYDKHVKSKHLKLYYKGELRFYYRDQEAFSEDFSNPMRDTDAPKLFETDNLVFSYDEFVVIDNRSGKPFELYSAVVGIE